MTKPIYLDYNATTPVAPEVAAAIRPWLETDFGNPSSSHAYGQQAHTAVMKARAEVATLIGTQSAEIVFTGNATEANNLALLGVARAVPEKRHMIVSAVEHPAVMQPALHLRELGWDISVVPVDATGRVNPQGLPLLVGQAGAQHDGDGSRGARRGRSPVQGGNRTRRNIGQAGNAVDHFQRRRATRQEGHREHAFLAANPNGQAAGLREDNLVHALCI